VGTPLRLAAKATVPCFMCSGRALRARAAPGAPMKAWAQDLFVLPKRVGSQLEASNG